MKTKILFIDDDESFLKFALQACKKMSSVGEVVTALNGHDAIQLLQKLRVENSLPKIIFVDINMPKMNGFEFLEEFNKMKIQYPEFNKIFPIAMLTSSNEDKDKQQAQELGVKQYLIKEISLSEFRKSIQDCIDVANI